MEGVLSVKGLTKRYPGFVLDGVSFDLRPGAITGFIGRNGAGKSTTFKCLLNMAHPSGGEISFFGRPFAGNEQEAKEKLGFALGGVDYHSNKKLKTITAVTKRFYPTWDEKTYLRYMAEFKLDENKTPKQLSEGMKVKYALALALSHKAELLILDEPTSGLDPVSRDELSDIFADLCEKEGVTIFFSTHITSDLEKCAHDIIYIKDGKLVGAGTVAEFRKQYGMEHLEDIMVFIERGKRPNG